MSAYLTANKKAAITARMRAPLKPSVEILLDEVAAAVAQGVVDAGSAGDDAIEAAIEEDGAIYEAMEDEESDLGGLLASLVPPAATAAVSSALEDDESTLYTDMVAWFEEIRPDYAASNVADLDQTVSEAYDDEEVQAISDKVDAILFALKSAGVMTPDA